MSHDIASTITDARPSTFPPKALRRVFVPGLLGANDAGLLTSWLRWAGESEFVWESDRASECGICIFRRGALGNNNCLAEQVKPFFDQHGLEANVFEFDGPANTFRRINPEWLATYYPPKSENSWDAFPFSPFAPQ